MKLEGATAARPTARETRAKLDIPFHRTWNEAARNKDDAAFVLNCIDAVLPMWNARPPNSSESDARLDALILALMVRVQAQAVIQVLHEYAAKEGSSEPICEFARACSVRIDEIVKVSLAARRAGAESRSARLSQEAACISVLIDYEQPSEGDLAVLETSPSLDSLVALGILLQYHSSAVFGGSSEQALARMPRDRVVSALAKLGLVDCSDYDGSTAAALRISRRAHDAAAILVAGAID